MRKFLLLFLIVFSIVLGYSLAKDKFSKDQGQISQNQPKTPILRFALVADSEDENGLLVKALSQAKGAGVNFVIGLGDWTSVGTVQQLEQVRKVFDDSGLIYYLTAGDHDLWDSRNRGEEALANFKQVFGKASQVSNKEGVEFVILDNSDIYKGIDDEGWQMLQDSLSAGPVAGATRSLTFVFAHKTPFHPQSAHVMGEDSAQVAQQAKKLIDLLEIRKVDGFFCGDLHFFAQFNSPSGNVKMTTVGAVASERNFQGPRFAIVTVYSDYSWEVADVGIR